MVLNLPQLAQIPEAPMPASMASLSRSSVSVDSANNDHIHKRDSSENSQADAEADNSESSSSIIPEYPDKNSSPNSKMSNKGPVPKEFKVNGKTPSGKPRLYVCTVCTRAFARQEHLKRHERSHTKEKPFACNICSRKFSRRDLLLRHSTKLHAGASDVIPRLRKKSVKNQKKSIDDDTITRTSSTQSTNNSLSVQSSISSLTSNSKNTVINNNGNNGNNDKTINVSNGANVNTHIQPSIMNSILQSLPDHIFQLPAPSTGNAQLQPDSKKGIKKLKRSSSSVTTNHPSILMKPSLAKKHSNTVKTQKFLEDNLNLNLNFNDDTTKFLNNLDSSLQFAINNNASNSNRRASFSAMSGINYAITNPEPYASETVEFSTPQFYGNIEEESEHWLNSFSSPDFNLPDTANSINNNGSKLNGYSFYDINQDDSTTMDITESLLKTQLHDNDNELIDTNTNTNSDNNTRTNLNTASNKIKKNKRPLPFKALSPILQEDLNSNPTLTLEHQLNIDKIKNWQETLFNQNINELERISDMNISKTYGIPQGYSFYGNTEQNSIPSELSSNATISPILLDNSNNNSPMVLIDDDSDDLENQYYEHHAHDPADHHNTHNYSHVHGQVHHHGHHDDHNIDEFSEDAFKKYSRIYLFTNITRRYIDQSLSKYPFLGIPSPAIPSNEVLNLYTDQFINKFLTHHPFIHKSLLNEYSLIKDTLKTINSDIIKDETYFENVKVTLICLPLLIATIGAIVSNKKNDASNLYEASRRCIHVYLESRKKLRKFNEGDNVNELQTDPKNDNKTDNNINSSPLWLIQSLTLSVIYGLFADEEISLSVIIRQVNALNSLIKSSELNKISFESFSDLKINSFEKFIKYESTIRTIHMIFHISTLLSTLYNIVPSLKIDDLQINLPSSTLLWECINEEEFLKLNENFDFDPFSFQEVLIKLINLNFDKIDKDTGLINNENFLFDNHVSEFGLICLQNGLHQMVYFKQLSNNSRSNSMESSNSLNSIDSNFEKDEEYLIMVGKCWKYILKACKLYNESSEIFNDCKILNHYLNLKLSEIISLNKIKENVWLRSFQDINELYYKSFNYNDLQLKDKNFQDELIKLVENSIEILKLVFFQDDSSLIGSISSSYVLKNETMDQLDDFYDNNNESKSKNKNNVKIESDNDFEFETENDDNNNFSKINLNILHKLSIDSQILFDVILIIVKFLTNYENIFKMKMKYNNLNNYSFLQHFDLTSTIFTGTETETEAANKFDELMFKYYLKFFKIYLNLEQFLNLNYNFKDFESESLTNFQISQIISNNREKFQQEEKTLNSILRDDLIVLKEKDLIINELIGFKLPYKFLKIGSFLFGFIYDKNFKFVNFKHLSDVLFHLRIFLESKDEYV